MLISDGGKIIRLQVGEISQLHRSTQGVKLIYLDQGEKLVGMARAERESESNETTDDIVELAPEEEQEES